MSSPVLNWFLAGVLCFVFGLVLGIILAADAEWPAEHTIIGLVQGAGDQRWDDLAWASSRIGDIWPGVLLAAALMALLCAISGRHTLALVFVVAALMRVLSTPLKIAFESPRPPYEVIRLSEGFSGFGYPSGHAFGATLIYGTLLVFADQIVARRWQRLVLVIVAGLVILLVAWSRVRLGVHWPSDVVGGVAFGFGCIFLLKAVVLAVEARRFAGGQLSRLTYVAGAAGDAGVAPTDSAAGCAAPATNGDSLRR